MVEHLLGGHITAVAVAAEIPMYGRKPIQKLRYYDCINDTSVNTSTNNDSYLKSINAISLSVEDSPIASFINAT